MTQHAKPKEPTLKAGAFMCPFCCVELIESKIDINLDGEILHDVKVLKCPICQEENFSPEHQAALEARFANDKSH